MRRSVRIRRMSNKKKENDITPSVINPDAVIDITPEVVPEKAPVVPEKATDKTADEAGGNDQEVSSEEETVAKPEAK